MDLELNLILKCFESQLKKLVRMSKVETIKLLRFVIRSANIELIFRGLKPSGLIDISPQF